MKQLFIVYVQNRQLCLLKEPSDLVTYFLATWAVSRKMLFGEWENEINT